VEAAELGVIAVRNIQARGRHGVTAAERERDQPFTVDVWLKTKLALAARSDRLADTIDYDAVYRRVVTVVERTSYALLERIAAEILDALCEDDRVAKARVRIAKPQLLSGATPSVTLCRSRR